MRQQSIFYEKILNGVLEITHGIGQVRFYMMCILRCYSVNLDAVIRNKYRKTSIISINTIMKCCMSYTVGIKSIQGMVLKF